eukprot:CAMPEP_0197540308 /NCGR_PEP_ID=MMETSP1318-20131121/65405_1 /TAXON_ID=552666 /ORGANISM="Partenskyella glossopodia, Strain RCC365" /LENGTH=52 /DNA_ID=CAMNT_0043099253 /DNA_START=98 /DNA_END=252 /DNA_ORIENTATION=-
MASVYARTGDVKKVLEMREYVFTKNTSERMDMDCYQTIFWACANSRPRDVET